MSKTDGAFEAKTDESLRLVGAARVAPDHNDVTAVLGKVDPADLEPRFIVPPPATAPPIIVDEELADREMARFDTTPGAQPDLAAPSLTAMPDHIVLEAKDVKLADGFYHLATCAGCDAAYGCAPQWHEDEVRAMGARRTREVFKPHRIPESPDRFAPQFRSKTSAERKAEPIHTGVMLYFPDALAAIARLSKAGNDKHNPGQPLHWSRGKSNDHSDCVARHSLSPDVVDGETGETELTAEGWRVLALLQLQQEKLLAERGIMPYSGVTP